MQLPNPNVILSFVSMYSKQQLPKSYLKFTIHYPLYKCSPKFAWQPGCYYLLVWPWAHHRGDWQLSGIYKNICDFVKV